MVKCWDLVAPLLNKGEKISIACPAYLSNGGREEYSHMGSKKIPSNTPLTYELEVLECESSLEDIHEKSKKYGSHVRKHFHQRAKHVHHSHVEEWTGDNTHDVNGLIRRTGGGPSPDWVGEIDKASSKIKPNVEKLKKIVDAKDKKNKKDNDDLEKEKASGNVKASPMATKIVKKEEEVISDRVVVEKSKKKVEEIEEKVNSAEKGVIGATDKKEEAKQLSKVKKAEEDVNKEAEEVKKPNKEVAKKLEKEADEKVKAKAPLLLGDNKCFYVMSTDKEGK